MLSAFGQRNYTAGMKQPTKIHGRPTFLHLRKLERELVENATGIECEEGGGAHGYLGLIKSAADYAIIAPATPFVMPVNPPALVIPNNTPGHESLRLQQEHLLQKEKVAEAKAVKKALGQMIKNAIDNEYLAEFLDSTTYQINKPLHEVMTTLYELYGQVRRSDTKIVEREVENMSYDLSQPPSIIWKAIDDLQKLAKAAKIGYSDEQLTEMGITIIQNTHDFEKGFRRLDR